jgi:hypothetical protein
MAAERFQDTDPRFPDSQKSDPFGHALDQIDAASELDTRDPDVVAIVLDEARRQAKATQYLDR